jgi:hypothetical protein
MNPLEERRSLTGARGHASGGGCPRTGSTMGFGRKKGEKSHWAYQNLDTIFAQNSSGKALANLVIFRLVHSTGTFTETLKHSTS